MFRRAATTGMIKLGPGNSAVCLLIRGVCRLFGVTFTDAGAYLSLRKDQREMRLAPRHFVYAPELAKRFDMYFSPLVPAQVNGIAVLDYSKPGHLQTYAHSGLQFELASFPEEEEAIESYFHWYRPKLGNTLFDVGAHCGVSSYYFSKLVGASGRVFCFEPDPTNYSLLVRNIQRHGLANVTPLQIAIAGTDGKAEFHCEETLGSGLLRHATRASIGSVVWVETVTLQSAFARWGPPQFCKMDIEGAELEVVSGSHSFLRSQSCEFSIDTNHLVDGSFTDKRIESLFHACGYRSASSQSGLKTTWASPEK